MMRVKSVLAPVPNRKKYAPCNVHEAPESVNLSVRHHHHQTVADIWNVDVKTDMHDMLITQEWITGPYQMTSVTVLLTKVRSRDPLLGNSKCLPVDECPQGQCGDHEHWNECGSSCNEDFCCPTMGHGGTMGGGTATDTSATGTAMGVRSLRNAFNINRN